jgi:hypothetical protein
VQAGGNKGLSFHKLRDFREFLLPLPDQRVTVCIRYDRTSTAKIRPSATPASAPMGRRSTPSLGSFAARAVRTRLAAKPCVLHMCRGTAQSVPLTYFLPSSSIGMSFLCAKS